mmetsp:Transcript_33005/g.76748  ORF Transcript_33005/g.76748 Transcript_33005/m.76748 type:complete len:255 (-) Transcript_33005:93-857(-)
MCEQLNLKMQPPDGADIVTVTLSKFCTPAALKEKVQYIAKALPEDQLLRFRNEDGRDMVELVDEGTLDVQGVRSGALVTIEQVKAAPASASQSSLSRHGRLSYYHSYREDPRFSSEQSVQGGGVPVMLEEGGQIDNAIRIDKFTWADDAKNVKIFVEAESEPRAIQAAGDGKGGRVSATFQESGFCLLVTDEGRRFVLEVPKLYNSINPQECKFRVSEGKRITVTLRKANTTHSWFTLLEASQASVLNNATMGG